MLYLLLIVFSFVAVIGTFAYLFNISAIDPVQYVRTLGVRSASESNPLRMSLSITSPAFQDGDTVPWQYTCDGTEKSPPLTIGNIPPGAKSLVLIIEDPDIPEVAKQNIGADEFTHWIVIGIPVTGREVVIPEGKIPDGAVEGTNSGGNIGYRGPCPPPQYEPSEHRYYFRAYALDGELSVLPGGTRDDVERAMLGHVIDQARLVGRYKRK